MTISLIHPSRSRARKSYNTARKWVDTAGVNVELILITDKDDPQSDNYFREYNWFRSIGDPAYARVIGDHQSVVHATNMGALKAHGDILIYLSDDFDCPKNWALSVIDEFAQYKGPTLIKVDDCLQNFSTPVLTIPMMNRELYDKLGYFWHPGYRSMFCDEHLYWRSRKLGALQYAPHLKFEHQHVSVGKAQDDETYRRSAANWNQGKALFAQHKAAGFIV